MPARRRQPDLRVHPLTPDRWADLCALFGERGACGGCWCMTPRLSRREYEAGKGSKNKASLRRLVDSGTVPGLLGYLGQEPVAWIAIEPRDRFVQLANSRILKPVDAKPVWSIVCHFIRKDCRGRGLSRAMIDGACRFAARAGATLVEAYPVEPKTSPMPAAFAWTGIASAFRKAGFVEVARRSATRPIMRRRVAR